jgi:hypothetical protein
MKTAKAIQDKTDLAAFPRCPALDGCHCQTNSLAKIYHFYDHPLSEEMLFGLGSGLGFMYWRMRGNPEKGIGDQVFIGGRGNTRDFFTAIGKRTGVVIAQTVTASAKNAESALLAKLAGKEPVMMAGDMAYLPWFKFPEEYHFGGHTFVACGWDGRDRVLASDMDPAASGIKKGFYSVMTLAELRRARNSPHKPFPPKNLRLDFDFSRFRAPRAEDIADAIRQTIGEMTEPPIKNFGIKGLRHTAQELVKWTACYKDRELRANLFQIYVFIEIGGTGGGCFRPLYARFLTEAAALTGNRKLAVAADLMSTSGKLFTTIALLFKDAARAKDLDGKIARAAGLYRDIADIEEQAFRDLAAGLG